MRLSKRKVDPFSSIHGHWKSRDVIKVIIHQRAIAPLEALHANALHTSLLLPFLSNDRPNRVESAKTVMASLVSNSISLPPKLLLQEGREGSRGKAALIVLVPPPLSALPLLPLQSCLSSTGLGELLRKEYPCPWQNVAPKVH